LHLAQATNLAHFTCCTLQPLARLFYGFEKIRNTRKTDVDFKNSKKQAEMLIKMKSTQAGAGEV